MQPLQICIGLTIRIGREIRCHAAVTGPTKVLGPTAVLCHAEIKGHVAVLGPAAVQCPGLLDGPGCCVHCKNMYVSESALIKYYLNNFFWYIFKASALWADAFYKSKCPSVCLSVCSLLRYRLNVFLPPLPEVGCPKFLEIQNQWGKKWSHIWTF